MSDKNLRPFNDWVIGNALWWKAPVNEPPYCGSPLNSDWPFAKEDEPFLVWIPCPEPTTDGSEILKENHLIPIRALRDLLTALEQMDLVGESVICDVCQKRKAPIGRSSPVETFGSECDYQCSAYRNKPYPMSLHPGERLTDFGYGYMPMEKVNPVVAAFKRLKEFLNEQ